MPMSDSRLAYDDCFKHFEAALNDPKGIRIKFKNVGDAINYRLRLHTARVIDRKDNKSIYPDKEHPYHGRSDFDKIRVTVERKNDQVWLYLNKIEAMEFETESLAEVADEEETIEGLDSVEDVEGLDEPIRRRL